MLKSAPEELVSLELTLPIWSRFFSVAPLIVVGTKEADGNYELEAYSFSAAIAILIEYSDRLLKNLGFSRFYWRRRGWSGFFGGVVRRISRQI